MNPLNNGSTGCDPISSNCVIWQGPDIACIDLCKGDSISAVIFKLATELCTLLDDLNINTYDLACLNLGNTAPEDFKGLIQILIDRICELEGIAPVEPGVVAGCPDCEVNTCETFHYVNQTGDTVTTMQLVDYVLAIGNRICQITGQITTINNTLLQLDGRVTILENAEPPVLILPELTPVCVLPPVTTPLVEVLAAVEAQFCELRLYTGDPQAIALALQATCLGINTSQQLSGTGTMADIQGWFSNPVNLAQSFSNVWKVLCDLRNAVGFIQNNCCGTSCNDIDLNVLATVNSPTELRLDFTGSIPSNYADSPTGSTIVITDAGGGGPQTINTVAIKGMYFDPAQPYIIPLVGVNGSNDVIVQITYRFEDPTTGSTCENIIQSIALGEDTCPELSIIPGYTDVNFTFPWNGTTPTFVTVELLSMTDVVLSSQVINITGNPASGMFNGLTEGTNYKLRLVFNGVPCESEFFTSLEYPCLAPTLNEPNINYINAEGLQNGLTIGNYVITYNAAHP